MFVCLCVSVFAGLFNCLFVCEVALFVCVGCLRCVVCVVYLGVIIV